MAETKRQMSSGVDLNTKAWKSVSVGWGILAITIHKNQLLPALIIPQRSVLLGPSGNRSLRIKAETGCCGFFGLFGHVLLVFLPNILPVSVAGIFRGQELEFCLCSDVVCGIVEYL